MSFQQNQWNDPIPPHHTVQSMSLDSTPADNDFSTYCTGSGLSEHITFEDSLDNKQKIPDEINQLEESNLPDKFLEYQLNNSYYHNTNNSMQQYFDSFSEQNTDIPSFPPEAPSLLTPEFQYSILENSSIASSPSLDFIPAPSPSTDFYTPIPHSSPELPFFPTAVTTSKPAYKKSKSSVTRVLSYESIMELDMEQPKSSPPPQKPLSHEKVMEALRAKLKRSASPKSKSVPEPIPPPNTNPTTGVLFLDLKHRRRKTTKKNSHKST
ncbi:hypothetical protein BY458DRAFT_557343 [Sporodiniella umbellata]|nr:hypothetical protein BY458DRAFT_557343 [Sporodiniella umbellata]